MFPFVAIPHNAAVSASVHVFAEASVFDSLVCVLKSGIARSYRRSMFVLLRNSQVVLQSGYAMLRSDQHSVSDLVSSRPPRHLFSVSFLNLWWPAQWASRGTSLWF